jgi:polyisoprenyl-teichoic acid--peptidoglycan teichoic acid transferase
MRRTKEAADAVPPGAIPVSADSEPEPWPGAFHRRWPRRLLIGANIVVAIGLIATLTAYGYVRLRLDQIKGIDLPSLSPISGASSGPAGPPETILIVGSDNRAGQTKADAKAFGSSSLVGGQRSDTVMLLRVDPRTNRAAILSIPRDLYVNIPGTHGKDRINSTFDKGPDLLVEAIHEDLGIEVNHYIEVDFDSFRGVVNAISGVKVYFPTPAKDSYSGLNITKPGCYDLNGDMALAYVRARHYEFYLHGRWQFEAESDLARIRRQQDFVRKVIKKSVNSGLTDPARINGVVGAIVNNLTVDNALKNNRGDMLRIVKEFKRMGGDGIYTATVPNTAAVVGGGDVLLVKEPDTFAAVVTFLQGGPLPAGAAPQTTTPGPGGGPTTTGPSLPGISPAEVHVRVLNGSGRSGQAGAASQALSGAGFSVTGAGSADNFRYSTSVVQYAEGQQDKASLLAAYVVGGATVEADPSLHGSDVTLVTGSVYGGIATPPPGAVPAPTIADTIPQPSTTTTTLPPAIPGTPADAPPC